MDTSKWQVHKYLSIFVIASEFCPKFIKCSANICPLDRDWTSRSHLRGEPICFYMREYVKQAGRFKLSGYIPRVMINQIAEVLPEINARHVDIKNRLKRSAKTVSKLDAFKRPKGVAT